MESAMADVTFEPHGGGWYWPLLDACGAAFLSVASALVEGFVVIC